MARRIAAMRGMSSEQEEMVRSMLGSLSDTIFTSAPGASLAVAASAAVPRAEPQTRAQLAALMSKSSVRRPTQREMQQMARSIGERCGYDQVGAAQTMLQLMTDVLFGPSDSGNQALDSLQHNIAPVCPGLLPELWRPLPKGWLHGPVVSSARAQSAKFWRA